MDSDAATPTPRLPPRTAFPVRTVIRWLGIAAILALYAWVHLTLAGHLVRQTNHTDADILGADQKHNLKLTLQTLPDLTPDFSQGVSEPLKNALPHRTDGIVNPLWPWVAAWLADPGQQPSGDQEVTPQDRELFTRGRWFNVGLTCGFVIILGLALSRIWTLGATANALLLIGIGAFLPRAVYYQPEPLYFIFFTLTWLACLFALLRNSLWIYALIGLFSGIAYLAKGSVHPLMIVFIGVSSMRWLWGWILAHWPGKSGTSLWIYRNHFFGIALLLFVHLMAASPRLAYAQERFGDPFHSYPGYWMWFDTFEDCFAWMNQHGSRSSLEALPTASRPSFATYSATHTPEQMIARLRDGAAVKLTDLLAPGSTKQSLKTPKPWKGVFEHRGWYLGAVVLLCISMGLSTVSLGKKVPGRARLHPESASVFLFVVGSFCAYTLAYGWYTPIGRGDRFMLSLYAPLVLSLLWASESMLRRARHRKAPRPLFIAYHTAQWTLFAGLAWRLFEVWQYPVFRN
jgi:hypothetical protein